jgi:hypothetical protein
MNNYKICHIWHILYLNLNSSFVLGGCEFGDTWRNNATKNQNNSADFIMEYANNQNDYASNEKNHADFVSRNANFVMNYADNYNART